MKYYPKSQVIPNLKTNGRELIYASTKKEYKGFYYKTSTNEFFSGKSPGDGSNQKLIQVREFINSDSTKDNFQKRSLLTTQGTGYKNTSVQPTYYPQSHSISVPKEKYKDGEITRYFLKKRNEEIYKEINKEVFNKFANQNTSVPYYLYIPFSIKWVISGDKSEVKQKNKKKVEDISFNLSLSKFKAYLKYNFTKFYKK